VKEILEAARRTLACPDFNPGTESRRAGDPPTLIADSGRAKMVLNWTPKHGIDHMIESAAAWHRSNIYTETILNKANRAPE
jgi:UDP-glucose 4-epimerase